MAGAGWRTFTAGAVLTAAQVQNYLADQSVQVYASAAARGSALGTAVATGMVSYRSDGTAVEFYNGSAWVALGTGSGDVTQTGVQTLTNKTLTSPVVNTPTISGGTFTTPILTNPVFSGAAAETVYNSATAFAGYTFYVTTNGAVQYIANTATANGAVNITSTTSQLLNTLMVTGQSITITMCIVNGATPYYPTSWNIDGTPFTPKWSGGTAPTAGNANSLDFYTLWIYKYGSGSFLVLASQTKFA